MLRFRRPTRSVNSWATPTNSLHKLNNRWTRRLSSLKLGFMSYRIRTDHTHQDMMHWSREIESSIKGTTNSVIWSIKPLRYKPNLIRNISSRKSKLAPTRSLTTSRTKESTNKDSTERPLLMKKKTMTIITKTTALTTSNHKSSVEWSNSLTLSTWMRK